MAFQRVIKYSKEEISSEGIYILKYSKKQDRNASGGKVRVPGIPHTVVLSGEPLQHCLNLTNVHITDALKF